MAYGYSPVTHTPEGWLRAAPPRAKAPVVDTDAERRAHLWRVLHGYAPGTHADRRAAFEELKRMGADV